MNRKELADILTVIKKNISQITNIPEFLYFNCSCYKSPEMHLSANGFKNIFQPDEVSAKKFSWDESGFKYEVFVHVVGIKVYCLMRENELKEFLGQSRFQALIA